MIGVDLLHILSISVMARYLLFRSGEMNFYGLVTPVISNRIIDSLFLVPHFSTDGQLLILFWKKDNTVDAVIMKWLTLTSQTARAYLYPKFISLNDLPFFKSYSCT